MASTAPLEGEKARNETFLSQKKTFTFTSDASSPTVKGIVGMSVHVRQWLQGD